MALDVHHIMIPEARSTAESTKLDIIEIDADKATAMALAIRRHCKKSFKLTLMVWCLMLFSTLFQLYRSGQCTYPCFPGVLLTSPLHSILSKPLAASPLNHDRNKGQQ